MAASATSPTPHYETDGLRPFELSTDLGGLADLLEVCFGSTMDESGQAVVRELRLLARGGKLVGALQGLDRLLGNIQQGFVWVEGGQVIGNTTVTPAGYPPGFGRGSIFSNVAVMPDFRRRGIAHALLEHALRLCREKGDTFAILQVDDTNTTAQSLYRSLGFYAQRTFTRWVRTASARVPDPLPTMPRLWRRPPHEWRAEQALAELLRPNARGGMGWLRPIGPRTFHAGPLARFAESLVGTLRESHVVYRDFARREQAGLLGAVRVSMAFGASDRADLLVHPDAAGILEKPLINYLLRRVADRHRTLIIEHPADDLPAAAVFREYGFSPRQTLLHMRIDLDSRDPAFLQAPHLT